MLFCEKLTSSGIVGINYKLIIMPEDKAIKGKIHSFESFGTLDGPGIRLVVFMSGCPLRCKYCHNIDVVLDKNSPSYIPEEIIKKILKNKPYLDASGGGVTLSGGDPVFQPEFLKEFLKLCKENNVHTAVDTSLYTSKKLIDDILPYTDLFMVSLKHFDTKKHRWLTGVPNEQILENIHYLSEKKARIWLRYLVLPGITDTAENLQALISFCKKINFELIEILAYHKMGVSKWQDLGLQYELNDVPIPKKEEIEKIKDLIQKEGFQIV